MHPIWDQWHPPPGFKRGVPFKAQYDLGIRPWTYDFFTWMTTVKWLGATSIDFKMRGARSTKWPWEEAMKRFKNYLHPGPVELGGMPVTIDDPSAIDPQINCMRQMLPATSGQEWERLRLRDAPEITGVRYTVTIRETFHKPQRNSDNAVWRAFAQEIGAHVIEDHATFPITLRDRFALYAAARQNYSVPNGPTSILEYTPYAFCIVSNPNNGWNNKSWGGHGIKPGATLPGLLPCQHVIWEKPKLKNLMAIHKRLEEENGQRT